MTSTPAPVERAMGDAELERWLRARRTRSPLVTSLPMLDGFVTAIAVLDMLDRNPGKSMADLYRDLPKTWGSPTMSPQWLR